MRLQWNNTDGVGQWKEADMTSVNLAKRVSDEDQIHVSSVGEAPPVSSAGEAPPSGPGSGLLDINQASAAELMALPGIGEVRSRAIVNYRIEIGRFQRIESASGRARHRKRHV